MNDRERFLAVARGETPDHVPIFGFPGAPGMSRGCMKKTHDRLVATGMPAHVGGVYDLGAPAPNVPSWYRYWGTTGPIGLDFSVGGGAPGIKSTTRVEDGYEIIEDECGAITRQVVDNGITYSMPEFIRYRVRDRASWEKYRDLTTPQIVMSAADIEANCRRFDDRTEPLCLGGISTYGRVRSLMGTAAASLMLYDDPELVRDIIARDCENFMAHGAPLIRRLKPEIVACWEDIGYKTGLLISPRHFRELCAPYYRQVAEVARDAGVPVITVDSDGNAMQLVPLLDECGLNSLYPFEAHANNDLFALRARFPEFVMFGWLEKEVVNEGNEDDIEGEIMSKVPPLIAKGRYFPNGDHGIQPLVTFPALCRFMTLLHEVCGNPEGEFPRSH